VEELNARLDATNAVLQAKRPAPSAPPEARPVPVVAQAGSVDVGPVDNKSDMFAVGFKHRFKADGQPTLYACRPRASG
jgi:hypothetical protein